MKNRVFFSLRTQFSNMGDLLINHLLIGELTEAGTLYVDKSGVPSWYLKLVLDRFEDRVIVLNRNAFTLQLLLALTSYKKEKCRRVYFVMKPGGYMAISSTKMFIVRCLQGVWLKIISAMGCVIVRAPSSQQNSIGISRVVDKFRLSNVHYHMIRDEVSVSEMKSLKLSYISSFDMASMLYRAGVGTRLFHVGTKLLACKNKVVFSFRKRRELEIIDWRDVYSAVDEGGYECSVVSQVFGDCEYNQTLSKLLDCRYTQYIGDKNSISEVMHEYSGAKFVVSNRLHVLMVAAYLGAIPVAVVSEDDVKVSAYMNIIGCAGNVVFAEIFTGEEARRVFDIATSCNWDHIRSHGAQLEKQLSRIFSNA